MKNQIIEIENTYIEPPFKHILIFEKKIDHDFKFIILDFFMLFGKGLRKLKIELVKIVFFHLGWLGSRSKVRMICFESK